MLFKLLPISCLATLALSALVAASDANPSVPVTDLSARDVSIFDDSAVALPAHLSLDKRAANGHRRHHARHRSSKKKKSSRGRKSRKHKKKEPKKTRGKGHSKKKSHNTASNKAKLASLNVSAFLGVNSGIGSWYDANAGRDSTNGHSWCYFPYQNGSPIFAPSLKRMLEDSGWDAMAARKKFCGLEAKVTAPNGKSLTLVIGDAFDDRWVRTPGSIDVMHNAFTELYGWTQNKNDVIQGLKWELTGNRNERYRFSGPGN